jgi:anti-sigma-K factor RskA
MKCAKIHPNLGAFALGGLEPEEATEIQHHLASCPSCRNQVRELEKLNQALEAAPPLADPPDSLKEEILSRMRDEMKLSSSNEELPSFRDSRFKNRRFLLPGVAAAALVATVVLGILFSVQTESQVAIVQLNPTEEREEYWGEAELHPQPSGNQQVELKLNNLEEPGSDSFYEAWFVSGDKYISAGSFTTPGSGQTDVWLTAPPDARNYHTLLVTKQPTTGDPAPTKEVTLRGEVP